MTIHDGENHDTSGYESRFPVAADTRGTIAVTRAENRGSVCEISTATGNRGIAGD